MVGTPLWSLGTKRPGWHRQRGATSIIVVVFLSLIISAMALAWFVGRAAVHKHEVQTAADSVAQSAALGLQRDGMGFANRIETYRPAWEGNTISQLPTLPALDMRYDAATKLLNITATVDRPLQAQVPGLGQPPGLRVRGVSQVQVHQEELTDVNRNIPKLVLVLDYSGSMDASFGGGQTRLQALRSAVNTLLDMNLEIHYGLVLYSDDVLGTVAVSDNSVAAIRGAIGRGAANMTCSSCGLNRAGELLRATDVKGRHGLSGSDGLPNNGGGTGGMTTAADRLRMNDDTTVLSLEIKSTGAGLEAGMKRVAGPKGDPDGNDPGHYFAASNSAALRDTFREIVANILCTAGPLAPAPVRQPDGSYLIYTFLRDAGGAESPVHDQHGVSNPGAASYDQATQMLRIPYAPDCEKILDRAASLVVRYDQPAFSH